MIAVWAITPLVGSVSVVTVRSKESYSVRGLRSSLTYRLARYRRGGWRFPGVSLRGSINLPTKSKARKHLRLLWACGVRLDRNGAL